jgi:prepilin-type N-terminal cleavage/methylation domain-containing protein
MRKQAGFTLVEILIAMTILAFIAMAVYENTTQSFALRDSVEQEGDFYNSLRVSLDILGRDITHIYTPQAEALPGNVGKAPQPNQPGQPGQQPTGSFLPGQNSSNVAGEALTFWGEPINAQGVRPSRLNGEETKLTFVIDSHVRLFRDSQESDFAKITYTLGDDKLPANGVNARGKVLIKKEDPTVFDFQDEKKDSETEVSTVLLDNIKSLKFEYLDGEKDRWYTRWDTAGIDHKNVFPSVIQITVEVFLPNTDTTFKVVQQYRPELPI